MTVLRDGKFAIFDNIRVLLTMLAHDNKSNLRQQHNLYVDQPQQTQLKEKVANLSK